MAIAIPCSVSARAFVAEDFDGVAEVLFPTPEPLDEEALLAAKLAAQKVKDDAYQAVFDMGLNVFDIDYILWDPEEYDEHKVSACVRCEKARNEYYRLSDEYYKRFVKPDLIEWLADPANRDDINYSDIFKDVYDVRPRWLY